MQKFIIDFYRKCDGSCPAVEFLDGLNVKMRAKIMVSKNATKEEIEAQALEAVKDQLTGAPKKIIVVPGRLVNIIA